MLMGTSGGFSPATLEVFTLPGRIEPVRDHTVAWGPLFHGDLEAWYEKEGHQAETL
jgi:hypothetical protein